MATARCLSGCSTLSVIGNVRPKNLLIVVWDNEAFVTPYGLPTPTAGFHGPWHAVARGMGIPKAAAVKEPGGIRRRPRTTCWAGMEAGCLGGQGR